MGRQEAHVEVTLDPEDPTQLIIDVDGKIQQYLPVEIFPPLLRAMNDYAWHKPISINPVGRSHP